MSIQPFNSFRQADDFFNVVLNTANSINSSKSNPRWLINASSAVVDRYKPYKKCIGVVNWIDLQPDANFTSGSGVVIRDVSSQQMNSSDSLTNQSNIIYFIQAVDTDDNYTIKTYQNTEQDIDPNSGTAGDFTTVTTTNTAKALGNAKHNLIRVGHPYEKVNPFGVQDFTLTPTTSTTAITPTNDWVIHITYYFYRN